MSQPLTMTTLFRFGTASYPWHGWRQKLQIWLGWIVASTIPLSWVWPGSPDPIFKFGTTFLSLADKLDTSNLVRRWIVATTSEWQINSPLRGVAGSRGPLKGQRLRSRMQKWQNHFLALTLQHTVGFTSSTDCSVPISGRVWYACCVLHCRLSCL